MARVALLIGTENYSEGFKSLPAAPKDVEAIAAVLSDPQMGGFDQVDTLIDQPHTTISETIETWFRARQKDDLVVLYISGHGVRDNPQLDLYFVASNTRKQKEELVRSTAVAASFVRDRSRDCKAKRQIIILDCCFSGAFGDLLAKDDGTIQLEAILGAEGRVVLTSSSSVQESFVKRDGALSIYTHYLVEGIRTGAADTDGDGAISVQELHHYASRKVQEESPAMMPKIIVLKDEGYQLRIANAPLGDPKVKYRKEAEAIIQGDGNEIDEVFSRPVLEEWQHKLGLTDADVQTIEAEILEPIRQRQFKIQRYRDMFIRALKHTRYLGERERQRLKQLQQLLGLLDDSIQSVEDEVLANLQVEPVAEERLPVTLDTALNSSLLEENSISHSSPQPTEDDLHSSLSIDYSHLQALLQSGNWQAADRETADRMLQVIGKELWWEVDRSDISEFPCIDLKTIDLLWTKHSGGQFGLSIQRQLYVKYDGNFRYRLNANDMMLWFTFCGQLGWRVNGNYVLYDELIFDISAPKGHLPGILWGGGSGWWGGPSGSSGHNNFYELAYRLIKCRL